MPRDPTDILTPQGKLQDIMRRPNLDVVMNLFRIPRAFAVSGFGDWDVGQHSFCVAFLGLYWATFHGYDAPRRDRLIVMGLTHDLHESATGDILPALKSPELRARLDEIQGRFLQGLEVTPDAALAADLKALDRIAFLYEIRCAAVRDGQQRARLARFFDEQRAMLMEFCAAQGFAGVDTFLRDMGIVGLQERQE
ncbi:MAG: HD domain-containing protein [Candidatus Lambdaproteobacteria bacterium]|nr:HD domain-containing protein [Candidatus Lambdaproteobacteria bacterium]